MKVCTMWFNLAGNDGVHRSRSTVYIGFVLINKHTLRVKQHFLLFLMLVM